MDSFEYAILFYFIPPLCVTRPLETDNDLVLPCSFAFSTLSDPCSWSTRSPLDSPDPLDSFDSTLHPTFEREIVSFPLSAPVCGV
jgi:hypothetical protein